MFFGKNDEHTEKAKKRREKRKKSTKAMVRRKLFQNFESALSHLHVCNRARSLDAKRFHLGKALISLDKCLEIRPGNHMLKAQRSICQEELWELEKPDTSTDTEPVRIILDPDWHG